MKKLKLALISAPLATMASFANAAVGDPTSSTIDLSALETVKSDLALAGGGLLAVVLVMFAAKKVASMFSR